MTDPGNPPITLSLDGIRRLGQALWMLIETPIRPQDLIWARGLLGENGPAALYEALQQNGALIGDAGTLSVDGLARFLCSLSAVGAPKTQPRLVWTLPPAMAGTAADDYCGAAVAVIESAQRVLRLVSPFVESRGVGRLLEALRQTLAGGISIEVVVHAVGSPADPASAALEQLRREALSVQGKLTVFNVKADAGLLVHSKLIVADQSIALLGSANLTNRGLDANFEAGIVVQGHLAAEIALMLARLRSSGLLTQTFQTHSA